MSVIIEKTVATSFKKCSCEEYNKPIEMAVCRCGNLDTFIQLMNNGAAFTELAQVNTVYYGRMDIIKWLVENKRDAITKKMMDNYAASGYFDIVKYLHENGFDCTTWAMDLAVERGTFETVKWLHENRSEGCTHWAMNLAAGRGRMDIIKWLHENRTEGCSAMAWNWAVHTERMDILKWLHENIPESYSTPDNWNSEPLYEDDYLEYAENFGFVDPMSVAIEENKLEAMKFLLEKGYKSSVYDFIDEKQPQLGARLKFNPNIIFKNGKRVYPKGLGRRG